MEEKKDEGLNKKVDESWKESVKKEAEAGGGAGAPPMPEVTFSLFMSGLMMEALIALGEAENPITKKKEPSLPHAKFIIDTLGILREKTKNNLDKDEEAALEAILYDLRVRFVEKARAAGGA